MQQSAIDAREQKILEGKYENIMLDKYLLYLFFPLLNGIIGLFLGGGISFFEGQPLNDESRVMVWEEQHVIVWDYKPILYCITILFLGFGAVYLTHRIQRKLSGMSHKNHSRLTCFDRISFILNFLIVFLAMPAGYLATGLSLLSMDNIP